MGIFKKIGGFFKKASKKVGNFFKTVWEGESFLNKRTSEVIDVLEKVKEGFDSDVADILVSAIPGDTDDKIVLWVRDRVPEAITKLEVAEDFSKCLNKSDDEEKLRCIFVVLAEETVNNKNQFYFEVAVEVIMRLYKDIKGETPDENKVRKLVEGQYQAKKLAKELLAASNCC